MRMIIRSKYKTLPALRRVFVPVFMLVLASVGCQQDQELTRMQAEVNRAATELVIQDAEARREWMQVQKRLDADRRQLAKEQRRDPIIAQAILQIGGIALCLLPLWLIVLLLRRSENDPVFHCADDTVLNELIGHSPALLPSYQQEQPPDAFPDVPPSPPQRSGLKLAHRDLNALIDDLDVRRSRRH